jgi:hypothetical protein
MLTEGDAVEIYKMKLEVLSQASIPSASEARSLWGKTRMVSKMFGVNTRTIKYIWNRQTWTHATEHLWPQEHGWRSLQLAARNHKVLP